MGPRRYRRGNSASIAESVPQTMRLQWGHDVTVAEIVRVRVSSSALASRFNGATTLPSRKCAGSALFGNNEPGFNGATTLPSRKCENDLARAPANVGFNGATTLPSRKCELYEKARRGELCFNGATTLPSRKYEAAKLQSALLSVLQWGHDVTVAEIIDDLSKNRTVNMLQWGHDVTVAEISVAIVEHRPSIRLQWGHDVTVAEIIERLTT